MKTPKFKQPEATAEKVVPLPDPSGAGTVQARFDALKAALSKRGRSSTIMTYGNKARSGGAVSLSGRLSDVDGARMGTEVGRS